MNTKNFKLTESSATGAPHNLSSRSRGLVEYVTKKLPQVLGVGAILAISTGASQSAQYSWLGQDETILTESQFSQKILNEAFSYNLNQFIFAYEQLNQIKQSMGLNILELSAILHVSRPTIYDWIESKKENIRKQNQERLNSIFEISKIWKIKDLGRLGNYLHKPMMFSNISLFELLKSEKLNLDEIKVYLDDVAQVVLQKRQEGEAHEKLLQKHGFEPVSKEDMEDRLGDIDFLD